MAAAGGAIAGGADDSDPSGPDASDTDNRTSDVASHWLVNVARRAGLSGAEALEIPPGESAPDAWAKASRALGIDEATLASHVANAFRLSVARLDQTTPRALRLVPERTVREHAVLPLRETDREVVVATADPANIDAEQAIAFASGRTPVFEVSPPSELLAAIERRYSPDGAVAPIVERIGESEGDGAPAAVAAAQAGESGAVLKLLKLIFRAAIAQRASQVTIGPSTNGAAVSFIVDGVSGHFMNLPTTAANHLISRLQVVGGVGLPDRARSRAGAARIEVDGHALDLRVAVRATDSGRRANVRVVDAAFQPALSDLGYSDEALGALTSMIDQSRGLIVLAGLDGAGKTTTVYAALRRLVAAQRSCVTIENPVERELPGVHQTQVDQRSGGTTAAAVRQALASRPDVVAVMEVTDPQAARPILEASEQSLVIACLRTRGLMDTLVQLEELGMERVQLGPALRGIVVQTLVRRLCAHCAGSADDAAGIDTRRPVGCDACAGRGFLGVIPMANVAPTDPEAARAIAQGTSWVELETTVYAGRAGGLLADGLFHVRAGDTTIEEVERAIHTKRVPAAATLKPLVLVADDDTVTRVMARSLLEQDGHRVAEAADGLQAIERIGNGEEVSLVILDLNMPRLDGREALKRLKSNVRTAGLPVIVLTGSSNPADEVLVIHEGADDYIRKPIDPPRFLARVHAALRRHASAAEGVS